MWALSAVVRPTVRNHGYVDTREQAQAAFREAWQHAMIQRPPLEPAEALALSPCHEPREQGNRAFVQDGFIAVVFVNVSLVRAPAHPFRLRRQVPFFKVAVPDQASLDLRLAPVCAVNSRSALR